MILRAQSGCPVTVRPMQMVTRASFAIRVSSMRVFSMPIASMLLASILIASVFKPVSAGADEPLQAEAVAVAQIEGAQVDVVVYGGTPAGIAAAISAARDGRSVLMVEPTRRIGGMITNGLSHTDFHSRESLTGMFLDFAGRVEQHYALEFGADSPQVESTFGGTFGEPKVNLLVLQQMLGEWKSVRVILGQRLVAVQIIDPLKKFRQP